MHSLATCIIFNVHIISGFDDHTNREITAALIRNVLGGLDSNNHYDQSVIRRKHLQSQECEISLHNNLCKGAACTYFKSRKSYHQRQASGKQAATAASSRKHQRRHNVS